MTIHERLKELRVPVELTYPQWSRFWAWAAFFEKANRGAK